MKTITIPLEEYYELQEEAETNQVTIGNKMMEDMIQREAIKMRLMIQHAFNPETFPQNKIRVPLAGGKSLTFTINELNEEIKKIKNQS